MASVPHTSHRRPNVKVFPDARALGRALAAEIADGMTAARCEGRRFILGCPSGRTPRSTFAALAVEVERRGLDLGHVVIAMMDEYLEPGPDGTFKPVDASMHHSCRRFGREEILAPLNTAASAGPIPTTSLWLPDPADPSSFDRRLRDAGGVDLFIIASGTTDGHVGFNPPGTPADSCTRVVKLAENTRRDNLTTFPDFTCIDEVPSYGITIGPRTLIDLSQRLVLVLTGAHKRPAAERVINATGFQPDWPATLVHLSGSARCYLDRAAAGHKRLATFPFGTAP